MIATKLNSTLCAALAVTALIASQPAAAISITFDYSYDTSGFFTGHTDRQTLLNQAASEFTTRLQDNLTAITSVTSGRPRDLASFNPNFFNPQTGADTTLSNYSIAADNLVVFVGAQNFGTSILGQGGPGGYSASGFSSLELNRNQSTTTDFGPWGGAISFSSTANWYFDQDATTTESFSGYDFYSVAVHELGHVLGFGTAPSFGNLVVNNQFTGIASSALYGGSVPMNDSGHWQSGLTSTVNGVTQEVSMDPYISANQRKHFTELDFAGLQDMGWQVSPVTAVPVPAAVWLFLSGLAGLFGFSRRRIV
ncbi:peptidase M10A and M12B matrixin and adamalysin [Sulfuricella denitrificans skB26]|uniref:Peptidase M10A and M12B matrixin and adamalysin n=1 Tax=Sulfuricella denitrificans (strain DSM 22764 / NBRC 105220 / skB26) TaxID=1163617 RepID=S6AA47_SULDS|nr:PEP-CTERM domain protein [Sulfuricella denitrificans]BAN35230.1 peptidase M10A and M12B matrixin and adamalysin [Sulfuricella denitrificans skB26]